jgi:hypothetical protein
MACAHQQLHLCVRRHHVCRYKLVHDYVWSDKSDPERLAANAPSLERTQRVTHQARNGASRSTGPRADGLYHSVRDVLPPVDDAARARLPQPAARSSGGGYGAGRSSGRSPSTRDRPRGAGVHKSSGSLLLNSRSTEPTSTRNSGEPMRFTWGGEGAIVDEIESLEAELALRPQRNSGPEGLPTQQQQHSRAAHKRSSRSVSPRKSSAMVPWPVKPRQLPPVGSDGEGGTRHSWIVGNHHRNSFSRF